MNRTFAAVALAVAVPASAALLAPGAGMERASYGPLLRAAPPGARMDLIEEALIERRLQTTAEARDLEKDLAKLVAARHAPVERMRRDFLLCRRTATDAQVVGYAHAVAAGPEALSENPAWKNIAASCPWYFDRARAREDMRRAADAQKRVEQKAAAVKAARDEAAGIAAQIAALRRAR